MPLFTPSTIPWVTAVQQVADSAGASGDSEMTNRAHNSLRAAFQFFNNKAKWNFLRAEGNPAQITGPLSIAITASAGQVSASALPGHGILVDDIVVGSGFIYGERVSATAAAGFGFFVATTGYGAGLQSFNAVFTRDSYDAPSDWKAGYSVRLLGSQRTLRYMGRRVYDRSISDEFNPGTPERYDLFNIYGRSKIRLLPPPSQADVLLQRYYRRMATQTASSTGTALDIPEDYESYPIAWAKWHFLTDKGNPEQATTWLTLANEGLKTMLSDQNVIPDEDLAFLPGHAMLDPAGGDRSTRYINWDE